jgi:hypothetical protein
MRKDQSTHLSFQMGKPFATNQGESREGFQKMSPVSSLPPLMFS